MRRHLLVLTVVGLFVFNVNSSAAPPLYVATNGSDSWSGLPATPNAGLTDGPLATLEAACEAARKLDKGQSRAVVVQAGQYFLDKTLVLTDKDSGLTIESAAGARACLIGGRKVAGWSKDGERFYSVSLPGVKEGKWDFRALVVNGRYCRRARLPEKGTFTHLSSFNVPWMTTTGGGWQRKPTQEELTTLKYKPGDLGEWLDVKNAEITVYHMWDESLIGLAANNTQSNTLTFSSPSGHPPGAFGVKKYVVWNVREGMTQAGQWYLDRSAGRLVYWPLPGEDMSKAEVFAPSLESIIKIRGGKDITIRGLALTVTTTPLKAGGFGAGRFDGAVSISSAQDCRLVELEVLNAGGQGIKASGTRIRVEKCHVHHTGACGIRCSGTEVAVTDSHIHDIGLTYPSALALQGGGKDSMYGHNEIHDAPYTAINCGGQRNRIEHNLIYRAMTELHDGGGIYCFAGRELVLRGNFIRDIVDTGGYGASAYYLDERSENCIVEGNLSVGIVRPSHNHMAKNNTIRNNVFINEADLRLTFPRSSGYTFEKNVLLAGGKITFDNPEGITTSKSNCFYSRAGTIEGNKLDRYSKTGTAEMKASGGNIFTDPQLIEFDKGKVRFAPTSPTAALGIAPIDVTNAGPSDTNSLIRHVMIEAATAQTPRSDTASIAELSDGRLMVVYHKYDQGKDAGHDHGICRIFSKSSKDGGKTWQQGRMLVDVAPGDMNVQAPALLRLKSGRLLLNCLRAHKSGRSSTMCLFASDDEGKSFSELDPVWRRSKGQLLQGGASSLVELESGRILLPMHGGSGNQWRQKNSAWCFVSDDKGKSWRRSAAVDLPKRGAMEPSVAQLADGTLLMSLRTQLGGPYLSRSTDEGMTWSEAVFSGFEGGESCTCLRRIPGTKNIVLFWNNSKYDDKHHHFGERTPLTAAVSSDNGHSWRTIGNIADDPKDEYTNLDCFFTSKGEAVLTYMHAKPAWNRKQIHLKAALIARNWFNEKDRPNRPNAGPGTD